MPYSPQVSAFQRFSFLGGSYNNGLSYFSGSDPSSYFPQIAADILQNQIAPDYVYKPILTDRLMSVSNASDTPISQWTPEQQSLYGKIWNTPSGPPTPTNSIGHYTSATSDNTDPNTGLFIPSTTIGKAAEAITSKIGTPGGFTTGLFNLSGDVVIIVVAILLLAVAAYSIVIPREARGRIATGAILGT